MIPEPPNVFLADGTDMSIFMHYLRILLWIIVKYTGYVRKIWKISGLWKFNCLFLGFDYKSVPKIVLSSMLNHLKLNIFQDSVSISNSGGASSHATWQKSALRLQLAGTELRLIHTWQTLCKGEGTGDWRGLPRQFCQVGYRVSNLRI